MMGERGGASRGRGDQPHRREPGRESQWGGRIGEQLHHLDRATRAAVQDASNALRRRDLLQEISWPLMAAGAAFAAGLLIAVVRRRRQGESDAG